MKERMLCVFLGVLSTIGVCAADNDSTRKQIPDLMKKIANFQSMKISDKKMTIKFKGRDSTYKYIPDTIKAVRPFIGVGIDRFMDRKRGFSDTYYLTGGASFRLWQSQKSSRMLRLVTGIGLSPATISVNRFTEGKELYYENRTGIVIKTSGDLQLRLLRSKSKKVSFFVGSGISLYLVPGIPSEGLNNLTFGLNSSLDVHKFTFNIGLSLNEYAGAKSKAFSFSVNYNF